MQHNGTLSRNRRLLLYPIYILILMPGFIKSIWPVASTLSMLIRGVAGLTAVILAIKQKRRSTALYALILYIAYILFVTLFNSFSVDNIVRFIAIYADIFIMYVFTDYLVQKDTRYYFHIMNKTVWIGLLLNVASVFLAPDGIVRVANEVGVYAPYYFYDYDNDFIIRYIPSLAIIFIHGKCFRRSRNGGMPLLLAFFLCLISLIRLHSSASMAAMAFIIVAYVFIKLIPERVISIQTTWISYLIVSLFISAGTMFTAGTNLVELLGKTTSLYKRTRMWTIALNEIPKNLLLGTGIINSAEMRGKYGFAQLHNSLLTTLLWGGIIGLIIYTFFIFSLQKEWKNVNDQMILRFMTILFAGVMITSLFDGIELLFIIYMLYPILANCGKINAMIEETAGMPVRRRFKVSIRRPGTTRALKM